MANIDIIHSPFGRWNDPFGQRPCYKLLSECQLRPGVERRSKDSFIGKDFMVTLRNGDLSHRPSLDAIESRFLSGRTVWMFLLVLGLFLVAGPADASAGRPAEKGQIYLLAVGEVAFANVISGPFTDVQPGDPVWMYFALPEAGEVEDPGHAEAYDVIEDSFVIVINDIGVGLRPGSLQPRLFVTDDYPIADALVMGPDFITLDAPGYGLVFECHDSTGTAWSSASLADLFGKYGAELFDSIDWLVPVPDGGIALSLTEFIIDAP